MTRLRRLLSYEVSIEAAALWPVLLVLPPLCVL